MVSRVALVLVSVLVGLVLAVGASYAAVALVTSPPTPSNQSCCNYGS
jgi:hypothetical protein